MPAMLPILPDLIVEFAPTNAPLDTAPTWVDISAYARVASQLSTRRGRTAEGQAFSYGTMTVTLSNRDRRFDPLHSAGPYFGDLKPRKQIRVRAVWSATSYTVFTGWVTGWPQSYADGGVDATTTIECVDALAWLAEAGLDYDPLVEFIVGRAAVATYMEFDSSNNWLDHLGNVSATLTSGAAAFGPPLDPLSGDRSAHVGGIGRWGKTGTTTSAASVDVTFSTWIQVEAGVSYIDFYLFLKSGGFSLSIPSPGIDFEVGGGTGANFLFPVFRLADGSPHFLTLVSDVSTSIVRVYIDGVYWLQVAGSLEGIEWGGADFFGEVTSGGVSAARAIFIQQWAVFNEAFTDAQVLQHFNASCGKVIESTSARCARILDNVSWPTAWRTLPPSSGLGTSRGECANVQRSGFALNALREVEATEQGRLFASKANYLTLQARYDPFEVNDTIMATFSDDGSDIAYEAFGWDYDDRDVLNDVTVNWSNGSQRSTDSTSIDDVGRQSRTINTVLSTQTQAADMAAGVVGQRKDPSMRTRAIRVQPALGAHWATILALEIGDRIRVEVTPMSVGSQLTQTLVLEAIAWQITGDQWTVELFGTLLPTDVFVLDVSELDEGRLGF